MYILDGHVCRGGDQFCRSKDDPGVTVVLILLISSLCGLSLTSFTSSFFSRKTIAELQDRAEFLEEAKQKADREVECMRALVSGLSSPPRHYTLATYNLLEGMLFCY